MHPSSDLIRASLFQRSWLLISSRSHFISVSPKYIAIFYSHFFYSAKSTTIVVLVSVVSSWFVEIFRPGELEAVSRRFSKELHFSYFYFFAFSSSILAFHLIYSSFLNNILACFLYRIYQSINDSDGTCS